MGIISLVGPFHVCKSKVSQVKNNTNKLKEGQKNPSDRVTAQHSCVNQNCIMGKAFRLKPDWVHNQKLHKQGILG